MPEGVARTRLASLLASAWMSPYLPGNSEPRSLSMRALVLALLLPIAARADDPTPLPGTKPFTESGDLASKMVDGIDRFLLRKIDEAAAKRAAFWDRTPVFYEAQVSANEPNR